MNKNGPAGIDLELIAGPLPVSVDEPPIYDWGVDIRGSKPQMRVERVGVACSNCPLNKCPQGRATRALRESVERGVYCTIIAARALWGDVIRNLDKRVAVTRQSPKSPRTHDISRVLSFFS
eukprot:1811306-Pyramimonas_sp.AAC.1